MASPGPLLLRSLQPSSLLLLLLFPSLPRFFLPSRLAASLIGLPPRLRTGGRAESVVPESLSEKSPLCPFFRPRSRPLLQPAPRAALLRPAPALPGPTSPLSGRRDLRLLWGVSAAPWRGDHSQRDPKTFFLSFFFLSNHICLVSILSKVYMISESYFLIISKNTHVLTHEIMINFFPFQKKFIFDSFINTHRGFGHLNKEYFF